MLFKMIQKTFLKKLSTHGEGNDWLDILPNVGFSEFLLKWKTNSSKSFVAGSKTLQFVVCFASQNVSLRSNTAISTLPQLCFLNPTCKYEKGPPFFNTYL